MNDLTAPTNLPYNKDMENKEYPMKMTIEMDKWDLPTSWASYLVNGDSSSLTEDEVSAIDCWVQEYASGKSCVSVGEEYSFCKYHDGDEFWAADDCAVYLFA